VDEFVFDFFVHNLLSNDFNAKFAKDFLTILKIFLRVAKALTLSEEIENNYLSQIGRILQILVTQFCHSGGISTV